MKRKILKLLLIIFIFGVIYSGYHILIWLKDYKKTNNLITDIKKQVKIKENDNSENIKYDFSELEKINDETIAWISIPNTNVDYPVVKHNNNSYYLNHSFDKTHNVSGWLFMDYRNKIDLTDQNTIIYAHGMLNGTMFGSLRQLIDLDNLEDIDIVITTKQQTYKYKIFSIYKIPTTKDYLEVSFTYENFTKFLNMIRPRSMKYIKTTVSKEDKILTLSTCYDDAQKLVVHAKLINNKN